MLSLNIEDADAWREHIQRQQIASKYPGTMCKPPAMPSWGLLVPLAPVLTELSICNTPCPSGVLSNGDL